MSRPLQQIGYQGSTYERPNDAWTCGKLACGEPCAFGPSSKGACGWTCTPIELDGGGLDCGRPGRGDCVGPTRDDKGRAQCCEVACQPAPTIRRMRGLVNKGVVLLTVAILTFVMAHEPTREAVVSPGGLSSHHAALACADCHVAAVASETRSITVTALKRERVTTKVDSAKCAACHELKEPAWRYAHTLNATGGESSLAALQSSAQGRWEGASDRPSPGLILGGAALLSQQYGQRDATGAYRVEHELDCLLCHGEHRGVDASLQKDVPEHRCTICHTVGFDSFEGDHPEFRRFGSRLLAGNLVFSHGTHYERYGLAPADPQGGVDFSKGAACTQCHLVDPLGRHMVLKPRTYERECLRCHQATTGPIEIAQVPSGPEVAWFADPRIRPFLPPLQDVVEAPSLLGVIAGGEDLAQVREDLGQLRSIHNKLLALAPVDEDGDERFNSGDIAGPEKLKPLKAWLQALEDKAEEEGDDEEGGDEEGGDEEGGDEEGGDEEDGDEEDGDEEEEETSADAERIAEAKALLKVLERKRKGLRSALKKRKKKSVKASRARAAAYAKRVQALFDALAAGDLEPLRKGLGLGPEVDLAPLAKVFPRAQLRSFQDAWWNEKGSTNTRELRLEPANDALGAWQGGGRFVASDEHGGLRYEGYTHLDPFLQELLNLAPKASPRAQAAMLELFAERCGKCHAMSLEGGKLLIQWNATTASLETQQRLNHFAHEAHLGLASCTDCHQLALGRDPADRVPNDFKTAARWRQIGAVGLAASGCRECHTPQTYGSDCQLCHDYHAGALTPGAGKLSHWSQKKRDKPPKKPAGKKSGAH
ncbi:MAG: hypothetical protein JKY65_28005 [Planctomycetes bacterium]|nr:hypothetical protein [Planctomycetota bacterium]